MAKPILPDWQAEILKNNAEGQYEADISAIRERQKAARESIQDLLKEANLNRYNLSDAEKYQASVIEARYDQVWWDEQVQMRTNDYNKLINEIEEKRQILKGLQISGTQETPNWHIVYGTRRVPGVLTFITTDQPAGGEFLHIVYTLAAHPIDSVQAVYINDETVLWNDDITIPNGVWGATGTKWDGKIFISTRSVGVHTTANSDLLSQGNDSIDGNPPLFPGQWTSNHIQQGRAMVYMILWFDNEIYVDGYPTIEFLIKGNNQIYDPRTDSTGYSANPALILMHHLTNTEYGCGVSWDKIDETDLSEQANYCDEIITKGDETTESRYECHGFLTDNETKGTQLNEILSSCGGTLNYSGGKWYIRTAVWRSYANLETTTDALSCSSGSDLLIVQDITINFWIKLSSTASGSIIGRWGAAGNRSWIVGFDNATSWFYFSVTDDGSTATSVFSGNTISSDVWYMVTARYDYSENEISICVNADDVKYETFSSEIFEGTANFSIGASSLDSAICLLKTVGIWNTHLADADIVALYSNATTLNYNELPATYYTNLVSFWNLDELANGIDSVNRNDSFSSNHLTDNNVPSYPSVILISEKDILESVSFDLLPSSTDYYNCVRGSFFDANDKYKLKSFPSIINSYYQQLDCNIQKFIEIALPCTTSSATAQRLAKILLEQTRQSIAVKIVCNIDMYRLKPGDLVLLSFQFMEGQQGWNKKQFEVTECNLVISNSAEPALSVALQLKETSARIYDWALGSETQEDLAVNINLPSPTVVAKPSNFTAASGTNYLYINMDGTIVSRVYLSWTSPTDPYVKNGGIIEIEYKKSSDGTWIPSSWLPGDASFYYFIDAQDGMLYDFRIRAKNILGARSDWVVVNSHRVLGKTELPSDVTGLTATVEPYGILIRWNDIADIDRSYYILKSGSSWDAATILTEIRGNSYTWNNQSSGEYTFRIKAVDTSGNLSTNETTTLLNISAPSKPIVTATITGENILLEWTESSGFYALNEYVLSYGSSVNDTSIASVKSTHYLFKANWIGVRQFWVQPKDIAGNAGTAGGVAITIAAPSIVSSLTSEVVDNNVLLRWGTSTGGTLPIDYYKIEKGETAKVVIGRVSGTFSAYWESTANVYTYWVTPVDTAGNEGDTKSVTATVSQPPDFVLRYDDLLNPLYCKRENVLVGRKNRQVAVFSSTDSTYLSKADCTELSIGNDVSFTWVCRFRATSLSSPSNQTLISKFISAGASTGEYQLGIASSKLIFKVCGGSTATDVTAAATFAEGAWITVVAWYDHSATKIYLQYSGVSSVNATHAANINNSTSAFAIGRSEVVGSSDHFNGEMSFVGLWKRVLTSTEITRLIDIGSGLDYEYLDTGLLVSCTCVWNLDEESSGATAIEREDSIGTIDLTDNETTRSTRLDWDSSSTSDIPEGQLLAPMVTNETVTEHYTNNSYTSASDFISNDYTYSMQPSNTSAAYIERIVDFGVAVTSSVILVSRLSLPYVNTVTDTIQISYSTDGETFSSYVTSDSLFVTSFRSIKVKLEITGSDDKAFGLFDTIRYKISIKKITDIGDVSCRANDYWGTIVNFNESFLDVEKIVVTPESENWAFFHPKRNEASYLESNDDDVYSFHDKDQTLCFWIQYLSLPQNNANIIHKYVTGSNSDFEYEIGIMWDSTNKKHDFYVTVTEDGDRTPVTGTAQTMVDAYVNGIALRQWYFVHFDFSIDSGAYMLRINKFEYNNNSIANMPNTTSKFRIGKITGGFTQPEALIRNVAIWDKLFSLEELDTLYDMGLVKHEDLSCERAVTIFDGTNNESLIVASNSSLTAISTEMTMTFWINLDLTGADQFINIIGKGDSFYVAYNGSDSLVYFFLNDDIAGWESITNNYYNSGNFYPNSWLFVACRYDGSQKNLFLNNADIFAAATTSEIATSESSFYMNLVSTDCTSIKMCCAGLWSRVLTNIEIKELFNNYQPVQYTNLTQEIKTSLISYWDLSESSGTRYDSHGTNHLTAPINSPTGGNSEISPYVGNLQVWYDLTERTGDRVDSVDSKICSDVNGFLFARALQTQGISSFEDVPFPTKFGAKLYHEGISISGEASWQAVGYKTESGRSS